MQNPGLKKNFVTIYKGDPMKKICSLVLAVVALAWFSSLSFAATSVDALLDKLVEKGTFTKEEARKLKGEIAADEKLVQEDSFERNLPDWVRTIKIKGDNRLRYQYEKQDLSNASRSRGRTRFRLGLEVSPTKNLVVAGGFATGGSDPRSTNVTWENTFEHPDIRLDYASTTYQAAPWAKLVGGKFIFTDYLWQTTDMLWDTDINPYGFSTHLEHEIMPATNGFVNVGSWLIDENNASKHADPNLVYLQGGAAYKKDKIDAKAAGTYYIFNGVKGYSLDNSSNTNTRVGSVLKYDYDSVAFSSEFGLSKIFGGLPFSIDERIAVFGDYIVNPDPSKQNIGWSSGFVFGNAKVGGMGQWQMKYQYAAIGKDAFPDTFPDSDRLGGRTDVKSHEVIMTIGLLKNVSFNVDYYLSNRIKGTDNPESLVQGDLNVKF